MMKQALTAARLREWLHYDADTGVFTWVKAGPKIRIGRVAGCRSNRYWVIRLDGVLYAVHRLAWLYSHGEWPAEHVDHINGNPDDNRIVNLRAATRSQNMGGYRKTYLGIFETPEEAHAAYFAAAQKRHGEFARAA